MAALLACVGLILGLGLRSFPIGGRFECLQRVREQIERPFFGLLRRLADLMLLEAIARQSDVIDALIIRESYDDPEIRLLMTLPGVDYTIAQALKSSLADITRFPEPDKAASYLGLVPSVKQSASKCYNGPITKAGSSQVRWLLIQAAQSVGANPGPLGSFFRKLESRKNRNVAVDWLRHREVVPLELVSDLATLDVLDERARVDEIVNAHQELALLSEVVAELPRRIRQAFTLRRVYGLSQMEISERMGISEKTVEQLLVRAVRRCANALYAREVAADLQAALWGRLKMMARSVGRKSPVGVVLVAPGYGRLTAKEAGSTVTLEGAPGELVLWASGRQGAAKVDADGSPEDVAALGTATFGL